MAAPKVRRALAAIDPKVAAGLALAAWIAWLAPFEFALNPLTREFPPLRALLIVGLAVVGLRVGRTIGLGLEPPVHKSGVTLALIYAAIVAVWCVVSDLAFRPLLADRYTTLIHTVPTATRILLFVMRAFNENIMYRLFLGTVLIRLLAFVWKDAQGGPPPAAYWTGFLVAQLINIWINVTSLAPVTPPLLAHDLIRYVAPALVWAWLYWKRGFLSCEVACTTVHGFLQPMLSIAIG
jgi:hypothetical protein